MKLAVSGELANSVIDLPEDAEAVIKYLAALGRITLLPPKYKRQVIGEPNGHPDLWTAFVQNEYD